MSWLARSFNSLIPAAGDVTGDGDDHIADEVATTPHQTLADRTQGSDPHQLDPESPTRGVKDDLSELTKTLSRQFWGVASFLAPPPSAVTTDPPPEAAETPGIAGIRSDFAEIGGRFRSGISKLSSNKAVTEISKIASSFLPFGDEEGEEEEEQQGGDGEGGAIGVTDEVLAFARNVAMHPETWLDFPLFVDDDESDEFDLSDTQQEHALAVEHLEPRLAALRIELCPSHMSEGCFWKIYFVLLHSRLNKHDAELLSTPQIVEARVRWLQELQYRTKIESVRPKEGLSFRKESFGSSSTEELVTIPFNESPVSHEFGKSTCVPTTDFEADKHPVQITEVKVVDKSVIEEELQAQEKNEDIISSASEISVQKYEEDMDDWLEEETGEMGTSGGTTIPIVNEDDVSFSDLEEDDEQKAH